MWQLLVFFIFYALSRPAWAENNIFIRTYSGIANNRLCKLVTENDVKSINSNCKYSSNNPFITSEQIYEWTIFQMSAKHQLKKNQCIEERTNILLKSDELMDQWTNALAVSWLGLKKTQLILERCEQISLQGRMLPFYTKRPSIDPKWLEICDNESTRASLDTAKNIFQFSLPINSSPEFFEVFEKHRSTLISKKTGKPLTDFEILNSDLSNTSFIETNPNGIRALKNDIKQKFLTLTDERKKMSAKINNSLDTKTNTYDLDFATRDYLFDDDTVMETLEKAGQLKASPGQPTEFATGAKCIVNHYEHSVGGEFAELALLSVFFYRFLPAKTFGLGAVKNFKTLAKATSIAAIPAGTFQALRETIKTCKFSQYQDTKLVGQKSKQTTAFIAADKLPKNVGFSAYEIELLKDGASSCVGMDDNLMLGDFKRFSCVQNALMSIANFASLRAALPIAGYVLSQ